MADPHSTGKQKHDITTAAGRKALAPRNNPYFVPFVSVTNAAIGFRKIGKVGIDQGTWIARIRLDRSDGSTGYVFESLGAQVDHHAAGKAAKTWFDLRLKGISDTDITVGEICRKYATAMETTRLHDRAPRPAAAKILRNQHANWIDNDPIANVPLSKLTKAHVKAWRQRLESTPDIHGKARSGMSINREMNCLRGPLNYAREELELVPDDSAWRLPLKPIKGAAGARELYLTVDQRKQLLAAAEPDVARFMKALMLLPLRPGAASKLTVAALDTNLGMLTIGSDKTTKATNRQLQLPPSVATFFAEMTKDKLPTAPLFTRDDGFPWTAREWGRALVIAREKAFKSGTRAHSKTTLYVLRHCAITDLARSGIPLSTIADWAGTSVAEIEKHYKKHVPGDAVGLAVLASGLGL